MTRAQRRREIALVLLVVASFVTAMTALYELPPRSPPQQCVSH